MRKKNRLQNKVKASKASSVKVNAIQSSPPAKIVKAPTLIDIAKMQAIKMDHVPDKNEPIVLSDTWYEYSVFLAKFHVCPNTAKKWLGNGWLPYSQIGKMRFINKTDIENMMMQFRRYTLLWMGWLIPFSGEWACLGI